MEPNTQRFFLLYLEIKNLRNEYKNKNGNDWWQS
jgi:hypothetical protein